MRLSPLRRPFYTGRPGNSWQTDTDEVHNLALALDGPALQVLKEIDDQPPLHSMTSGRPLNVGLATLMAYVTPMRRCDNPRQTELKSLVQYELALRALYREAWPDALLEQRDLALKHRFEDGVLRQT